jgi:N-acetylmuramoyl-L-alanine amidase
MVRFLINPGHGGMIHGKYQTAGKMSPVWDVDEHGREVRYYEGYGNRKIAHLLMILMLHDNIEFYDITCGSHRDIGLDERCGIAQQYCDAHSQDTVIGIDLHSNAGGGSGFECLTYPGDNEADELAEYMYDEFQDEFPGFPLRTDHSDGDSDKERPDLYMLRNTPCPWVIVENFFMDNEIECRNILMKPSGIHGIAKYMARAIKRMNDAHRDI